MNRTDLLRKVRAAADELLRKNRYVSPVEVLLAMGRLSKVDYERWRFRQIPYLEKVLPGSLEQHAFFCRELRAYARDELKLKPSRTAYMSWGKGRKQPLRFTKFGKPHLEEMFSTHYVSPTLAADKKAQPAEADVPNLSAAGGADASNPEQPPTIPPAQSFTPGLESAI